MLHLISKHRLYGVQLFKAKQGNKDLEIGMKYDGLILIEGEKIQKILISNIENMENLGIHLKI